VGPDERPEDELEPVTGEEPDVDVSGEPENDPAGEAPTEPAPTEETHPSATEADEVPTPEETGGPVDRQPPRHRALKAFAVLGGTVAVAMLLVGWNRVATSDGFCASCHDVEEAVASADRSVHSEVPCLSCHSGSGLVGVLRYTPTLAREALHTFTGWEVAHDVLAPRACESCHTDLSSTPELAAAHGTDATCQSCHGDVAHPEYRLAGFARPVEPVVSDENPHPTLFVQTHGDDVVRDPESCTDCHEADYCETCHFRETYPHPDAWISQHGPVQEQRGIQACQGCHPVTFCAGCHGTEIPHSATWLDEHWRNLTDASVGPCLQCHPKTDCTVCHAQHSVHREQDLYA